MKKLITLIAVTATVIALSGIAQGGFNEADFRAELSGPSR